MADAKYATRCNRETRNGVFVCSSDDGQTVTGETSHEGRELVNPAVEAHDQIVSLVEDMVHPGDDGQTVTKVTCQEECEVDPKQEAVEAHDQIVSLVEDMVPPGDDGQTVTRVTGHEGSELVDPEREAVEAHDQIVSLFEDMVPLGDDGQTVTIVTGHEGLELVYPEREAVEAHDQIVSLVEDMVPPGDDRQTVTKVTGHEECEVDPEQEAVWTHDQIVSLGDDMVPPGDDGQTVTKVTGQEECEVDPKQEAVEAHDQIVSLVEDMVPPGDDRQTVTIVTGHEECEVDPEQEAVGTHDQIVSLGDDMVPPGYNPGEYILTKYGRSALPAVASEIVWRDSGKFIASNSAVARTSVLGVHMYHTLGQVIKNALDVCRITHFDPRCEASCVAVSTAIALIIQKNDRHLKKSGKYDIESVIDESFKYASQLLETDKDIKELKAYLYCTSLKDLRLDEPGKSSHTYKALGAGFWALKQKDFRAAIQSIALEGGDADANGAVAGALLGCKLGLDSLPRSWLEPLINRVWLDEIIDRYFDMMERKKRQKETVV